MVNSETAESVSQGELWVKGEGHRALEIKGLGSQESLLQRCETKVGTQQRSLLMIKLKSVAGRRMGELCRRNELCGE